MKKPITALLVLVFCLSCGMAQAFTYGPTIFEKDYDYRVNQWRIPAGTPSKAFSLGMGAVFDSADMKGISELGFVEFSFLASVELSPYWGVQFIHGDFLGPQLVNSGPDGYEYKLSLNQQANGGYLSYLWAQYPQWVLTEGYMPGIRAFSLVFAEETGLHANDFSITLMKVGFYAPTPIPGAIWLLGSGLVSLAAFRARHRLSYPGASAS